MKKILISILFISSIFTFSNIDTPKASAASASVNLLGNQSSASTSRISTNSKLTFTVSNYSSIYPVRFQIFRYGVVYTSGMPVDGGDTVSATMSVPAGDYSMRIYCGDFNNPRSSGCLASGTLKGN